MARSSETPSFFGHNILADAENVVASYDPTFGQEFALIPRGQEMSLHYAAVFVFLHNFPFEESLSDEVNARVLRETLPIWQNTQSLRYAQGDSTQRRLAKEINKIHLLDLENVARSQLAFFEEQDALSQDTNLMPIEKQTLRHWRNARRISAIVTSQYLESF